MTLWSRIFAATLLFLAIVLMVGAVDRKEHGITFLGDTAWVLVLCIWFVVLTTPDLPKRNS